MVYSDAPEPGSLASTAFRASEKKFQHLFKDGRPSNPRSRYLHAMEALVSTHRGRGRGDGGQAVTSIVTGITTDWNNN